MTGSRSLIGRLLVGVLLGCADAAAVEITSPSAGAVFKPGDAVNVMVAASPGEILADVAVTTGLTAVQALPVPGSPGVFQAQVHIPIDRVGPFFLITLAALSTGNPAVDYVRVQIDPGSINYVSVSVPPAMSVIGAVFHAKVIAMFDDGILRDISDPQTGTTYTSSDPAIVGVHQSGMLQARANGTAIIEVANRGKTASAIIRVDVPVPPNNQIPVPDPGPDRTVAPQTVVILSAAGSTDADGDPLQYRWQQQSGRAVVLRDENTVEASFVAPRVSAPDVVEFSLVVRGRQGATSFPAIVRITVQR